MLQAVNINLTRDDKAVLTEVNIALNCNEVVALVGPNGAGKSSLFNVISGELFSTGQVLIEQKLRATWPPRELAERLAILPQSSQLNFPFSAFEVVNIGRMNKTTGHLENEQVIRQVMSWTDIQDKAQNIYTHLSGGEKQRVQLARTFAQIWEKPSLGGRYLLLDEPTAALDLYHQHQLLSLLKELALLQIGSLVVLHDLNLAARYADRIVVLDHGKVVAQGTSGEVFTQSLLKNVFSLEGEVITHPKSGYPVILC
ncbi:MULTISPECIES: heme ABC transporter ATP-binding protein [unclassified Motilimonas]|uniref:heme ABC transporter ATP-binding protein n=1 Tax=Motilimonas TaxID=1914248 RepID=UPI001E5663D5|nr:MULTISPECIES: heme ABC transporter ATP-binding protein [unclassified Motilimonas]MCE0558213.1 heme ABC transporter ATP-binding protein [Motilimonas sp. E26]MDO6526393.1 heme ABC transporter ATP-binding protein [Motilimonas sp. 1_MG-2023]